MKKVGKVFLCFVPLIVSIVLQFACSIAVSVVCSFIKTFELQQQGITDLQRITEEAMTFYMQNLIWVVALYQIIALLVFALWYYFGCGRPKAAKLSDVVTPKTVIGTLALGIGLEFFVSAGIALVSMVFPSVIQDFSEMIQQAGIGEATVGSVLAAVIIAPIGEEILCRGLIFHYAKKVSSKFIIANSIQALAFGIMHMNLVQGVYAFVMGFVFGILYERFHSLYLCIFAHFVVNFSASFMIEPILGKLPETIWVILLIFAAGLIVWLAGLKIVGKPQFIEKEDEEHAAL